MEKNNHIPRWLYGELKWETEKNHAKAKIALPRNPRKVNGAAEIYLV
jgi:hypothetical protein